MSGAGWFRAFFTIWVPLLGPYLALIGLFNFNQAANTTSSIILLADRDTITLSVLQVFYLLEGGSRHYAAAAAVQIIIGTITLFTALAARHYGVRYGVRHR